MLKFQSLKIILSLLTVWTHMKCCIPAAFHLGLHCFQKYPFSHLQYTNGLKFKMIMVIVKLGFASMNSTTYSYEKIIIYVMKRLFLYTVYAVNICIKNVD